MASISARLQAPSDDYDYLFKVILIGDCGVGKTSLLRRFCHKSFDNKTVATVGVDFLVCDINIPYKNNTVRVKLQLWDTSGEEKYRSLSSVYYRNAECVVVMFDMNCKLSFESLSTWLALAFDHCGDVYKVLVGNKSDLDLKVSYTDIQQLAYYNSLEWVETSAKDSTNVEEVFEKLAKALVEQREQLLSMGSFEQRFDSIFFDRQQSVDPQPYQGYCCSYV